MEQSSKSNIGIGGEDEIDCFSPDFNPEVHWINQENTFTLTSTAPAPKKKQMKTASFGTGPSPYQDDPEEEKIDTTSSKPKSYITPSTSSPSSTTVMVGPDFDHPPPAQNLGPSKQGDQLESTLMGMLGNLNLRSDQERYEDEIAQRMNDYVNQIETQIQKDREESIAKEENEGDVAIQADFSHDVGNVQSEVEEKDDRPINERLFV